MDDGYGSISNTFKDAKVYNNDITLQDVKDWLAKKLGTKKNLREYNSFVVDACYIEYQLDLFFFQDLEKESSKKQPSALIMIDIFNDYCVVVEINSKQPDDVLNGIYRMYKTNGF